MKIKRLVFSILLLATVFFLSACNQTNAKDKKLVDEAYATLEIGYQSPDTDNNVTKDITLVDLVNEVTVTWGSSKTNVISITGKVTRQDSDANVTLTATLSKGKASLTKTFNLTVVGIEETVIGGVPKSHEDVKTDRASLNLSYSIPTTTGQGLNTLQKIAFIRSLSDNVLLDPNTTFSLKSEGFIKQAYENRVFVEQNSYLENESEFNLDYEISLVGLLNETLSASEFKADVLFRYGTKNERTYKDVVSNNDYSLAVDGTLYLKDSNAYLDGNLKAYGNNKGALIEVNNKITEGIENIFMAFEHIVFGNVVYPDSSMIEDQSLTEIFETLKTLKIHQVADGHVLSYEFDADDIAAIMESMFGEEIGEISTVYDSSLNVIIKIDADKKLKSVYLETNIPVFGAFMFSSPDSESSITLEVVFDTGVSPEMPANLNQYQELDYEKFEELEEILSAPYGGEPIDRVYDRGQNIYFFVNKDAYYQSYRVEVTEIYETHHNQHTIYIDRDLLELDSPGTHTYNDGEYEFEYTIIGELDYSSLKGVYKVIFETEKDFKLYAFYIQIGEQYYLYHYFSDEELSDQQLFDLYGNLEIDYDHLAYFNYHPYYDNIYLQEDNVNAELQYSGNGFYARNYYYYSTQEIYGEFVIYQKIEGQTCFPVYKDVVDIEIIEDDVLYNLELGIDTFADNTFLVTYDDDTTEIITFVDFERITIAAFPSHQDLIVEVTFRYKNYLYYESFAVVPTEDEIPTGGYLVSEDSGEKFRVIVIKRVDYYELRWTYYHGHKDYSDVTYEDFTDPVTYYDDLMAISFTANKAYLFPYSYIEEYDLQIHLNGFIIENTGKWETRYTFTFEAELERYEYDPYFEIKADTENLKTNYVLGDMIDPSGLTYIIEYADSETYEIGFDSIEDFYYLVDYQYYWIFSEVGEYSIDIMVYFYFQNERYYIFIEDFIVTVVEE
ncbi:MAG: immunoglobulin-like domain-containing protein [Acholeplasmataceae bacterium]